MITRGVRLSIVCLMEVPQSELERKNMFETTDQHSECAHPGNNARRDGGWNGQSSQERQLLNSIVLLVDTSVVTPPAATDLEPMVIGIVHKVMSQYISVPRAGDMCSAVFRFSGQASAPPREDVQLQTASMRDMQPSVGMFAQEFTGVCPFGLVSSVEVPGPPC